MWERAEDIEDAWPLSPLQAGMLYQHLRDESSDVVQHVYDLEGPLDVPAFVEAWRQLGRSHGVLRSGFEWDGLEPRQFVMRDAPQPLRWHDWQQNTAEQREERLAVLLTDDRDRGLRIAIAPPARINLARLAEDAHLMVWTTHHLLMDGSSRSALTDELMRRYAHLVEGTSAPIPASPRYGDFVTWLYGKDFAAAESFWREELAGLAGPSPLPAGTGHGTGTGEIREVLTADEAAALRELCRAGRVTTATVIYAMWALTLSRRIGTDDVVLATSVSLRSPDLSGAEDFIGLLINTIPARIRIDRGAPLTEWLRATQTRLVEQREHGYCGLPAIRRQARLGNGVPLFDTLVGVQNYGGAEADMWTGGDVRLRLTQRIGPSGFPLVVRVWPGEARTVQFEYERAAVDVANLKSMWYFFRDLIARAARNPAARVAMLLSE